MDFFNEKNNLLSKVINLQAESDISGEFKKKFFDFISNIIINMIQSEDSFFGCFMLRIEKDIRLDITAPIATIPKVDNFIMYFNPILFLRYEELEMAALFKHEIYHIMYLHHKRERALRDVYSNEAVTIALDISINQFIKNMPFDAKRIETVSREFNIDLKKDRTVEEYAGTLQRLLEKRVKESEKIKDSDKISREVDISTSHKIWEEIDISHDIIDNNVKKIALSLSNEKLPDDIMKLIQGYNKKSELSWENILKNMLPSMRSGYKKTIMRRDRRQPDRADLRGKLPNMTPEIVVAIDISASMTDDDIKNIMIEILSITQSHKAKITVIECDNEIRRVYKLSSPRDIRKRKSNTGSTAFSPVIKYMRENNLRNNILVYFTDGVGEKELEVQPISKNIIWVLTGNEEFSLKKHYGYVKRINKNKVVGEGKSAALEMIREVIHDWAR